MPGLFVDRGIFHSLSARVWCWIAGLAGMFLGMEIGAVTLAGLPIDANSASAQFFLTYAAMVIGMCLGMLAGCEVARHLALRK